MMARMQIQIALGAREITAVLPDRDLVIPLDQPLSPRNEDPGPKLQQGFDRLETALRDEYGDERLQEGIRLQVALIPPLSEARLVDLPPLRPAEVEAVLRRTASRHFLGGSRNMVLGGERFGKGGSGGRAPVFAAAAGRSLVEAVHQAVESRGWRIERIVPAQAAWLHALREAAPLQVTHRSVQPPGVKRLVVAFEAGVTYLIRMDDERPDLLRRISGRDLSGVAAEAGPEPGHALVLAQGEARASLVRGLADAGWDLIQPDDERSAGFEAARHTAGALPELVSPRLALARRRRDRSRTRMMLVAGALMLVAAAAVHLWGVDRALGTVQSKRAAMRQLFAPALALRDSLDRMVERTESLQTVERETTRWTAFLVELSTLLPRETHLVSLRGADGRVIVEAEGDRAGEALSALRGASTFRDARIEGLIRRDLEGGATSREHFTLSMELVKGGDR